MFRSLLFIAGLVKKRWSKQGKIQVFCKAQKGLIHESATLLRKTACRTATKIYIPLVGCGNGELDWDITVEPILKHAFNGDNRFTIIKYENGA